MVKEAIIIGGSNAGLMHGIMLKHHGYTVTILEQQEASTARQGFDAGIHMGPDVQSFLKEHDRVRRDFTVTCTPSVKYNVHGRPKLERGQTLVMTSWGLLWTILRANFEWYRSEIVPVAPRAGETDGVVEYRNGARVVDVRDVGDRVEVRFEDVRAQTGHSISADLVIVADGSGSSMRSVLMPGVTRQYAGYMCWRGTVKERLIDDETNKLYAEHVKTQLMKRNYIIMYTIPTDEGDLAPGERLHNWVWYQNLPDDSAEMDEIFTDINGKKHLGTVPRGLVRPEAWEKVKERASSALPEGLASIIHKTPAPFVTKIFDVASPKALFFGGKLFLVGDAQITLRPNAGMSTQHAAYDCNMLEQVVKGEMSPEEWERAVLRYGAAQRRYAILLSSFGLQSKLTAVWNLTCWLLLLLGQRLGLA